MVDGNGQIRPHWRALIGAVGGLGKPQLDERAGRLARAAEDEGVASLLPGITSTESGWRCDPIPLPITAREFAALEAGLTQRARLLEAVLADIYGPQHLLREGLLPAPWSSPTRISCGPAGMPPTRRTARCCIWRAWT